MHDKKINLSWVGAYISEHDRTKAVIALASNHVKCVFDLYTYKNITIKIKTQQSQLLLCFTIVTQLQFNILNSYLYYCLKMLTLKLMGNLIKNTLTRQFKLCTISFKNDLYVRKLEWCRQILKKYFRTGKNYDRVIFLWTKLLFSGVLFTGFLFLFPNHILGGGGY